MLPNQGCSSTSVVKGVAGSVANLAVPPQVEVRPECGRTFGGKRGVSQHWKKAHHQFYYLKETAVIGAAIPV